jgi:hypothetical protein
MILSIQELTWLPVHHFLLTNAITYAILGQDKLVLLAFFRWRLIALLKIPNYNNIPNTHLPHLQDDGKLNQKHSGARPHNT